jgi:hypothetical protein
VQRARTRHSQPALVDKLLDTMKVVVFLGSSECSLLVIPSRIHVLGTSSGGVRTLTVCTFEAGQTTGDRASKGGLHMMLLHSAAIL